MTTKNVEPFFNSLITAQAPETFTLKFLQSLEFKSTNDRLFIGVLKGLGFLDEAGKPTNRYYDFLDQSQSKKVLAEAIKETYSDLFAVNKEANKLDVMEIKNKFRTLTQGKNSDHVLSLMANTFKALVDYAQWDNLESKIKDKENNTRKVNESITVPEKNTINGNNNEQKLNSNFLNGMAQSQFHYDINIHLPESRDQAVYDALFKSLKEYLF